MSWLSNLTGAGIGGTVKAVAEGAETVAEIFTTSDREKLEQFEAETDRIRVENAGAQGQLAINREEARHPSVFVAGWRSFIGWACGAAFVYHFLIYTLIVPFIEAWTGVTLRDVSWQELSVVLMGLLGLGGLRTYEKRKGIARDRLK